MDSRLLTMIFIVTLLLGLASGGAALAHSPIKGGFFTPPEDVDLCTGTSIESHAELHSNGHADHGFDNIVLSGRAVERLGLNDCPDD